ncbi:hypothetical protein [Actinoplanes sp. NBRC 103695]|uniref:hypothetical protein n=1 Tax=Actinoplanes sp. NBRC 103695 TaxID=3032202 RepID=UPI0024A05479|nr:hypothetical protein [Actinoplanes sp. NBRC 103695]GLZ01620.1 hypothetical protein Acsp02_88710 [Actinoplanes sp. NBRC 103695]
MTAEMVVMNRSAIALAADSAVTITSPSSDGGEVRKIYANANKLFELIRGRPVGIMIYNSADFVQVPWETLVKVYRSRRVGASFNTVPEYVADFCAFLRENVEQLIPADAQKTYAELTVSQLVNRIIETAEDLALEAVEEGKFPRINASVRKAVLESLLQGLEANTDEVAPWAIGLTEAEIIRDYASLVELVPDRMQGTQLTKKNRLRVLGSAISIILRNSETPATTGVVIAGFGESDVFPSAVHVQIGGLFAGRLVVSDDQTMEVTAERPSIIRPFAQTTEAATFLFGIDPAVKQEIEIWWGTWLNERLGPAAQRIVSREAPSLSKRKVEDIGRRFTRFGGASWSLFAEFMNELHSKLRYGPIEASAAYLSKGEIASLAENMVNLASLRNRVSIDRDETVGGAIDVAVISPGDGFVWIRRKHYFDQRFNPTWAPRQQSHAVVSLSGGVSEGGRSDFA